MCVRQVADAEVRIVRASNYVRVVEEALRKTPGGNVELEEELGRARDELASATRQREEGEAEQRLADALLQRSFGVREHAEDQLERLTATTTTTTTTTINTTTTTGSCSIWND